MYYKQIFIFFLVPLGGQTAQGKHPRKKFKSLFLVFTYIFSKEYHSTIVIIFIFNVQPTLLDSQHQGQGDHKGGGEFIFQ